MPSSGRRRRRYWYLIPATLLTNSIDPRKLGKGALFCIPSIERFIQSVRHRHVFTDVKLNSNVCFSQRSGFGVGWLVRSGQEQATLAPHLLDVLSLQQS